MAWVFLREGVHLTERPWREQYLHLKFILKAVSDVQAALLLGKVAMLLVVVAYLYLNVG